MSASNPHYINMALNQNRILNHIEMIKEKKKLLSEKSFDLSDIIFKAGHIELQLTDKCCLNCPTCHFRKLGDNDFSFSWLDKVIHHITPKAITFAGGGEPTMYYKFNAAVLKISEIANIKLGLITNGVIIPEGQWYNHLSWVRISLYSIHNERYAGKSISLRERVLNNIDWYLKKTPINNIGIHFLFYQKNISECVEISKLISNRFREYIGSNRLHLQFKPAFMMIRPDNINVNIDNKNRALIPSLEQTNFIIEEFQAELLKNKPLKLFLNRNSNYQIFEWFAKNEQKRMLNLSDPKRIGMKPVKTCYNCLAYQLITPTGFIYPCLSLAEFRRQEDSICHIDDIEYQYGKSIHRYFKANTNLCNNSFCRNWSQNEIVESYLSGKYNGKIPDDLFF